MWYWSWKRMTYFRRKHELEPKIVEKLLKEKKND